MGYLKLFTLFLFFACLIKETVYSVEDKVVSVNSVQSESKTNKKSLKLSASKNKTSKKTSKKIVRQLPKKEKKSEGIKATNEQLNATYSISKKTINLKSPMCQYAEKNDVITLKRSLMSSGYSESEVNTICKNNESLLMIAVKNNNYLTAKLLLEKGADINTENIAGVTPLHIIARSDHKDADRILALMIRNTNLNINAKDLEGYTPLMRAVEYEKIEMIKKLVELKADLNVKNNYGFTVVDLAKMSMDGKKNEDEKNISKNILKLLER